jgi:TatD DNase family protein
MIDTHCHLNADVFKNRVETIIQDARGHGVTMMFVVGWDERSSQEAVNLSKTFPSIKAIIGLHPVDSLPFTPRDLSWIESLAKDNPENVIAIGEIGLDYHWHKSNEERHHQSQIFLTQVEIAHRLNLPIVIHCRDAYTEILTTLKNVKTLPKGVMHCYGGLPEQVPAFLSLGFDLSFGGLLTFKNAHQARESLKQTPLHRLHIETDSPYLAPHPYRGKENTPIFLPLVFEQVKQIHNQQHEVLEEQLNKNAYKLFHVKTL